MKRYIFLLFFSTLLILGSCKVKEKPNEYNYLQNAEEIATEVSTRESVYTIQKGDQIAIQVTAKNMDVVKPFNGGYYSSQNTASPNSTSNPSNSEKTYIVDNDGNIDFPVIGNIQTNQKSLEELKENLTTLISTYVKNPTVSVRFVNFKVTVLGEVARPNQYTLTDINPTILNAIGLAGDLTMYGKRDNILVVRNVNGEISKQRINLLDANFIQSPFYQLKQGDVIYVSANETKEKTARLDPNTNIYIAVAGTIIGLAGIFITIFKK